MLHMCSVPALGFASLSLRMLTWRPPGAIRLQLHLQRAPTSCHLLPGTAYIRYNKGNSKEKLWNGSNKDTGLSTWPVFPSGHARISWCNYWMHIKSQTELSEPAMLTQYTGAVKTILHIHHLHINQVPTSKLNWCILIPLRTFPILELPTGDLVQRNIYPTRLSCIANLLKH